MKTIMPIMHFINVENLSTNFSSSRHDRKKLNTDSESALNTLKKGLKYIPNYFLDQQK